MRLRPSLLALLATAASLLAGCGATAPPTPTPEPLTVRFVYPSSLQTAHYERLAADFEIANPGVDVVLQEADPYNALSSTSAPPDVAEVDQLSAGMLADAGFLLPLDPLTQETPDLDLDLFYPGTVQALRYRGKLWGLPADADPIVLYFNKDLFDAAAVSYPTADWTWDDLLAAAMELTDPLAQPPVYGLLTDMERADFVPIVYQNGGSLVDSLAEPTAATFTEPATVEAIEWYASLSLDLGVSPTPSQLDAIGGLDMAAVAQRGAMWYGPLSERGGSGRTEWRFSWGVVAPPGNVTRMTLITMRAYVLGARSERPAAAWDWLRFLALHPSAALNVPPLTAASDSQELREAMGDEVYAAATDAMSIGHTIPLTPWIGQVGGWLGQALTNIFQGRAGAAEALSQVQDRAEALLAEQDSGE